MCTWGNTRVRGCSDVSGVYMCIIEALSEFPPACSAPIVRSNGLLHATSMAQLTPPPPSSRAPNLSAPNSNVPNASTNGVPFVPRKEFIRDQRVVSSFSLLALSGPNLVRLYSFPLPVISALRRLFDHQNLTVRVREHSPKNFFEFSLNGRPWASPKTIESEKLIVGIMSSVLQCGYSFLSTIEYGREPDDRLAIAFSKRVAMNVLSSSGQSANGSAVTLLQPVRTPFAISFVSPSVLHVIGPPLHSTPAILQAVRGSWPRGVVSEKKLGDAIYQFKLKGYKCAYTLCPGLPSKLISSYIASLPTGYLCCRLTATDSYCTHNA